MISKLFIRGVSIDWNKIEKDSYLYNIEAIHGLSNIEFHKPITFFVGENGTGKSTVLEAIAVAYGFNPEGGSWNYRFSTYDSHSDLCRAIRLTRGVRKPAWGFFLRAESFYNVATAEEEYSRGLGGVPEHYHERSHGESFLALAQNNFRQNGLYLLDEPEAALSPQRQLTLLAEIYKCAENGAQFIIVTHSPLLLGIPESEILSFDDGIVHTCGYEETDSYKITSTFMNNREQVLHKLLE